MKKKIRMVIIFAVLVLAYAVPMSVSASDNDPYQEVIDKLNEEFSMDIHFMTPEERAMYSDSSENIQDIMTPEELEEKLRKTIIVNNRANEEADRKIAELETKEIEERTWGVFSEEPVNMRTTSLVTRYKAVAGATITLGAEVSNSPGYWVFTKINNVYSTADNSDYPFVGRSYRSNLIDSGRTCALEAFGRTMQGGTNIIVDANARRYAEFWAGSGM